MKRRVSSHQLNAGFAQLYYGLVSELLGPQSHSQAECAKVYLNMTYMNIQELLVESLCFYGVSLYLVTATPFMDLITCYTMFGAR